MTDPGDRPAEGLAEGLAAEIAAALEEVPHTVLPIPTGQLVDQEFVWSREGRRFAGLACATASFRLGPEIAAAALRTPDVAASPLGPDWVAFSPPILDGHARDRLVAWFVAAHRRAAP